MLLILVNVDTESTHLKVLITFLFASTCTVDLSSMETTFCVRSSDCTESQRCLIPCVANKCMQYINMPQNGKPINDQPTWPNQPINQPNYHFYLNIAMIRLFCSKFMNFRHLKEQYLCKILYCRDIELSRFHKI